jgi:hypothetical protein
MEREHQFRQQAADELERIMDEMEEEPRERPSWRPRLGPYRAPWPGGPRVMWSSHMY